MTERIVNFIFEVPSPNAFSAGSISLRITCLNHEALNDSVKDDTVVIIGLGMRGKILHSVWSTADKTEDNVSRGGMQGGAFRNFLLLRVALFGLNSASHTAEHWTFVEYIAAQAWGFTTPEQIHALTVVGRCDEKRLKRGCGVRSIPFAERDGEKAFCGFPQTEDEGA